MSKPEPGQYLFVANLLLPLRIFMGITFVYAGIQHLTDPTYFDPSKPGYIGHLITQYAVGSPLHNFLLGVVEPNAYTFGYVVAVGETLIGIAALVGLFFRVAACAGLLLNFTFFLSATWNAFPFYFGSDIVFVMCWLTLLLSGPQPRLSLDGTLANQLSSLRWLVGSKAIQIERIREEPAERELKAQQATTPEDAKLYPKQVLEIDKAFERIRHQFVAHRETQTILEFVRAFVISLGVDRKDAVKILEGISSLIKRDTSDSSVTEG